MAMGVAAFGGAKGFSWGMLIAMVLFLVFIGMCIEHWRLIRKQNSETLSRGGGTLMNRIG